MKKYLLTVCLFVLATVSVFSQNLIKQCTPGSFYYNCGAAAAHQSEQGPWLDLVINGNQNSWYQGYGVESASWKEYDNGTAVLTTRIYQIINKANVKFDMNLTFSNKGAGTPHGGGDGWHCLPSNTNDWYYYRAATGSITGVAGTHVQGVTFTASLIGGSALQIGTGGSINSTTKYGMSAWLNLTQTGGWNTCWKKGGTDLYFDLNNCTNIPPPSTCNNLTSGGTIGSHQSGCNPFLSSPINSISLPSGGDVSKGIEYVWMKSTTYDGTAATTPTCVANTGATDLKGWSVITGATGTTYNPGTITQTTWYLRCARRAGCPCYYGESNIVKITITGDCVTGGGTCPNLVNNGNFGAGFTGFTTEIRKNTWADCSNGGSIDVVSNSNAWGFAACGDKDGNGKFLLVDFPAGDIWQKIWQQTVAVQPNTNYTFTFWAQSVFNENPAKLIAVINNQMFTQLTLPTTTCQWVKYEVQWNSGSNTTANLMIKNNNPDCHGNDFGIDAISFNCNGGTIPTGINCAAAVTVSNNGPKCVGQGIQLSANGTSSSNGTTTGGTSFGNNLVVNGNFDAGNTGFTSELIYKEWDGGCDNYSVTSTPQNDWKWPAHCSDHTGNSGKMAIFDTPSGDAWKIHWKQCINVQPNTNYEFSYWATSLYSGNPARLYSVINNMNAGNVSSVTTIGTTTCQWQKITFIWNSGSATQACIMLKNENGDCNGNDFAIDDVSFRTITLTNPTTCTPSYAWTGPNGYTSSEQNPTVTTAGTYTVTYKDKLCCTATASTAVAFDFAPAAAITGNLQICNGATTTLTAQGGSTYKWSNGSTASSITVGAGIYTVTVVNAAGCSAIASATVTNTPALIATITGNLVVCNGLTTKLTAQGGDTFIWSNGSTASSITVGAGTYNVTVVNAAGCTATASTIVTNSPNATASIIGDLAVCNGSTTTLTAQGGGTYLWSNGSTSQSITVSVGTYTVTATNTSGCAGIASATVSKVVNPQVLITGNLTVCNGSTTTLTAQGGGTYLWSNGSTASNITVGVGTYSVEVTNAAGCKATASATVTTSAGLVVNATANPNSACLGANATLSAAVTGGTSPYTYKWTGGFANSNQQTITFQTGATSTGTYTVTVTDANGCTGVGSANLAVTNFTTAITGGTTVCIGKTTTLTAQDGSAYLWSNGSTAANITVGAGTYTVTVTNTVGCKATASATIIETANPQVSITGNLKTCNGATTTLTANANGSYIWSNGSTAKTITVGAGTYSVTVSNGAGCSATASATVTNSTLAVAITGEPTVCQNATTTLTANGVGSYKWSNGSTASSIIVGAGTYSVTATNTDGCTATNSITITTKNCNTSSVGDYVFCDKNGNGVQDGTDTGIAGVLVTLTGTNASGQAVNLTATTDANGKYLFPNLQAGTYKVTFAKPVGYVSTGTDKGGNDATDSDANANGMVANIVLAAGQNNATIDAGFYQLSSIGDFVFCDKNNDGIQNTGDTPLANVVVTLTGTTGDGTPVTLTTTTDAVGKYIFTDLKPGTYTVNFAKPTGFNPSPKDAGTSDAADSDIDANGNVTVTVTSGTTNTTVDAGFNQPAVTTASIGDYVFCDKNGNGVQDGTDTGIAGVLVTLTGTNASGQAVNLTATTDANGKYLFPNLQAGTYKVTFAKPVGYVSTGTDKGGNDATDSDADANGMVANIVLAAGQNNATIDAGFYQLSSIGDFVFEDKDNNGVQGAGEPGISGVTVVLNGLVNNTPITQVTSTDVNGKYKFINLLPGSYTLTFQKPTGYVASLQDQGTDDATDSDANPSTGVTASIVLTSGQAITTIDAGFSLPSVNITIGDFIFLDCNKNNIQDGDAGLAGVTVKLKNAAGTIVATTITDANGKYSFAVAAGSYNVCFTMPTTSTGLTFVPKDQGTNDAIDSDVNTAGETGLINFTATNNTIDAGVSDIIAPVLTAIPADATVSCSAIPAVPSVTATDNCDKAPIVMFASTTTPITTAPGQYLLKRTWTAVDKCGNKSTKTWTLCVKDDVAPVITNLPKDVTVECDAIPAVANPTITDNCDNNVSVDYTQTIIPGSCPDTYKIKRSWSAKDAAGNVCVHVQYVCVQDTKAPVITGIPADVTVKCGDPIPFPPAPGFVKGTDNCDAYVTLTFSEIYYAGNCNGRGLIKCQWTAVDNCGNIAIKIWTITLDGGAVSSLVKNTQNSSTVVAPIAINRELIEEAKVVYTDENINVFPNPTYGQVTVNLGIVEASKLVVINEIGQAEQTILNPSNQVSLDLGSNRKGFYTIQVFTLQGILTKKLILIE
jgi:hypothetical protein